MKYRLENWSIEKLLSKYNEGKIQLNPPYQRRFIWSLGDQQELIHSIERGFAIPSIFLFEKDGQFEMVDGQQRTRTILSFLDKGFKSKDGIFYDSTIHENLKKFSIPITIIEELKEGESIEEFYSLVNKSGVHLNRPELKKAEYFETNFLKLITDLADNEQFKNLNLFTDFTTRRMNDVDFVSELVTQMKVGITDKKQKVDDLFKSDISDAEYNKLKDEFKTVIKIFSNFNEIKPIKETRFKQRNDFYSLFGLIHGSLKSDEYWNYIYKLLIQFNDDILPSNDDCEPFQEYAFNCISQSNSKAARTIRLKLLKDLFLNPNSKPNTNQRKVLKFYKLIDADMEVFEECLIFNLDKVSESKELNSVKHVR